MGDVNRAFYEGKAAAGRLRKLAEFYDKFSDPYFEFVDGPSYMLVGTWLIEEDAEYTETAANFIRTCIKDKWIIAGFDWAEWAKHSGAAFFDDHALLMDAEPIELAKVLTVIFGREHANHGYLVEAYGNGLLLTVLKRAHHISAMQPFQEAA